MDGQGAEAVVLCMEGTEAFVVLMVAWQVGGGRRSRADGKEEAAGTPDFLELQSLTGLDRTRTENRGSIPETVFRWTWRSWRGAGSGEILLHRGAP